MSTVDSKVVQVQFDNKGFAEGIRSTLQDLNNLTNKLSSNEGARGLNSLGKAADEVSNRFSLMRVAAVSAVATIASQVTRSAEHFVAAFTIDPIKEGFGNYETQINAVQTILANTGLEGSKGLAQVTGVLKDLNTYANQTVYNFSDMTKNIGTFTAAGIQLKPAANAIKGIANLAALSGSSTDQASSAMYQLSQALAANQVKLQDWNSVVNAGLGGKVFQQALFNTGQALHTIKGAKVGETFEEWTKSGNSFRGSLQKGWITGKVLSQTLANFTGDLSAAQLKSEGYNKVQIAQIIKQGKVAVDSATKIKTVTQLAQALKEEVGTAYASIFKTLIGDIDQAKNLLSGLHTSIENALTNPIYKVNAVLEKWAKLGGRVRLIDAIHYALKDIQAILVPIDHAFRDIFPAVTAKRVYEVTNRLEKFFQFAKIGVKTQQNLKKTFEGFFAVLDIGKTIIEDVYKFIGRLFSALTSGQGSGGILKLTGHLGDFLVQLDKAVKHGHGLTDFFNGLFKALAGPIKLFQQVTHAIANMFGSTKTASSKDIRNTFEPLAVIGNAILKGWLHIPETFDKVVASVKKVIDGFKPFTTQVSDKAVKAGNSIHDFVTKVVNGFKPFGKEVLEKLKAAGHAISNFFGGIDFNKVGNALGKTAVFIVSAFSHISHAVESAYKFLKPFASEIGKAVVSATHGLGNFFSNIDYSKVLSTINTALFAGLVLLVKKFLGTSSKQIGSGLGFLDTIKEPFEELTKTLKTMQQALKATVLLEIAVAIGILAVACVALAKIDSAALSKSLQAIGTMMAELFGSLLAFNKIGGPSSLVSTSAGLVLFAGAILVLTSAVTILSKLDVKALQKGLGSLAILIGEVVAASAILGKASGPMISAGVSLLILSGAIKILVGVVEDLGKLDISTLRKGLIGVGSLLGGLALFSQLQKTDANGLISGAGLLLLAEGVNRLSKSVEKFGKTDTKVLEKGLISVGAILAGFALFSQTVGNPATLLAAGGSLILIALAMQQLVKPLRAFGQFSWEEIAKGLITMAVALGAMALALSLMPPTTLLSAAAILVVASSLQMIGQAMQTFSGLSWEDIAKGLVTMAGALTIIAVATTLMTTALPGAAAILVVAAALQLLAPELVILGQQSWEDIGKGLAALAGALTILGVAGLVLTPIIPSLLGLGASILLLGVGVAGIGAGVFLLATGLVAIGAGGAAAALGIVAIGTAIISLIPVIITSLVKALDVLVTGLAKSLPTLVEGVQKILLTLIKLIVKVAPPLIDAIILVLAKLLNVLAAHAPKFFDQMVGLLLALLKAIEKKTPDIVAAVLGIINAILKGLAGEVGKLVEAGLNIIGGLLVGIGHGIGPLISKGAEMIGQFIVGIGQAAGSLAAAAFKAIVDFINATASAIRANTQPLIDAGENIASAIGDGLVKGMKDVGGKVADGAKGMAKSALSSAANFLGIASPSKKFIEIGQFVAQGFAQGITQGTDGVKAAWTQASDVLNQAVSDSANDISNYKQKLADANANVAKSADKVDLYTKKLAEASKNHKTTASTLERLKQELKAAQEAHTKAGAAVENYTKLLKQATDQHLLAKASLVDLNKHLDVEHAQLTNLAAAYDTYNKQLDIQKQKLSDLKQVRDDYNKSVTDEFNILPDVTTDTTVGSFTVGLQEQIADLAKFTDVLGQLRAQGLDDATYKLLVSKGPVALPFMEELLAQGTVGISTINNLDSTLNAEATALGGNASSALYQAGVDAVQGLVDGLEAKEKDIETQMDKITAVIVASLKKSLGIQSPSKVLAELGAFAGAGVVVGLDSSSEDVANAASRLGNTAADALKKSISGLSDQIVGVTDLNPTITPVLDLTEIKKNAGQLTDILKPGPVLVNDAFLKARAASAGIQANKDAANAAAVALTTPAIPSQFTFVQNNTSPKALSSADIYRQTKNQLSVARGALTQNVA